MAHAQDSPPELDTLKLTYERLCKERDRLRDARGFFSRGLGPAPASAGIATALVSALGKGENPVLLGVAVFGLVAMVGLSVWYDGKPAYRHIHADKIKQLREEIQRAHPELPTEVKLEKRGRQVEDELSPADWYRAMIRLERRIYGPERSRAQRRALKAAVPWAKIADMQEALDLERTGLRVVQALWVVVVVLLVLSVVV